jgi:hypothetical protein
MTHHEGHEDHEGEEKKLINLFSEFRTAMLEHLRGLGEFSKIRNISDSDIPPAKAPRTLSSDEYFFFFFAAFASLREIIRNSVAASPRWALRGEFRPRKFAVTRKRSRK